MPKSKMFTVYEIDVYLSSCSAQLEGILRVYLLGYNMAYLEKPSDSHFLNLVGLVVSDFN